MAPGCHLPDSFRRLDAVARKLWPVASSLAYPSRLSAAFRVPSEIGRDGERTPANRKLPLEIERSAPSNSTAWRDNGIWCGRRIFIRDAGIDHTARSKSNSVHSAKRNSPGRGNKSASNCNAIRVLG